MYVTVYLLTFCCFCLILDVSISYFPLFTDRFIQAPTWHPKSHPSPDVGQSPVARSLAAYRRPYKQFVKNPWCLVMFENPPKKQDTSIFCKPWKQKNRTKSPSAFRQRTQQPFPAFSSAGAKARASFCASQHAESTPNQTELIYTTIDITGSLACQPQRD